MHPVESDLYSLSPYDISTGTEPRRIYLRDVATFTAVSGFRMRVPLFSAGPGSALYGVPANRILHVVEATAFFTRTSGTAVVDAFAWDLFDENTPAGSTRTIKSITGLTSLSFASSQAMFGSNAYFATFGTIRNVDVLYGEVLQYSCAFTGDVNISASLIGWGWLLPRGNIQPV
ncbi:MAG: hypothetical protein NZM12_04990 [Steroidobacteraceae bacterium]|nr:hypothetical protein [Steroidobacteraceae bacterium]MDW8260796.1 hypothetical protein [Gammaproteobacteria bacterium]